ncbi:PIG-L family deacetylase [Streptomyces sp. S.PB5]|uniref:PIG-L family deacetylase n=1 Tax=Streptomyces sp. S.PB5 TaxID=3020844 RepID=UPI00339D4098
MAGSTAAGRGLPDGIRRVPAGELACAARELGVERVELAGHLDGALDNVPVPRLAAEVTRLIGEQCPTHLLVLDTGGVTGHRDHQRAMRAALFAARGAGAAVVAWTLPRHVANRCRASGSAVRSPVMPVRWRGSPRASARRARCRARPGRRAGGAGGPGHVPRRR